MTRSQIKQAHDGFVDPKLEIWILVATILASSMSFISSSVLTIIIPSLQTDLNANGTEALWINVANPLFLSALILVCGSLGDHFGRKRIFKYGVGLFTLASIICGFAPNTIVLIIFRAIQGIGGAMMVPGSLAIITASFPKEKRGRAIGTWSTFSALTTIIGPVIGGWLAGQGLWRMVFFMNIPLAIIVFIALTRVPESRDENAPKQLDYTGALLAVLGLAGLTFGFIQAPDFGWDDPRVYGTIIGGMIAFAGFIYTEATSTHPMMPLRLFKSRTFSGANAMTLFLYGALSGALFFFPLNLIQIQGYPEEIAALTLMPLPVFLTIMGRWSGGLVDRIGSRLPLVVGAIIVGFGFALFALPGVTAGPSDYWTTYFPPAIVLGFGMGIIVAPLTTTVMTAAPEDQSGTASGINNAVSRTAGVLAVAIMGSIAIISFGNAIEARSDDLDLSDPQRMALIDEASKLGDASPPDGLTEALMQEVDTVIKESFVDMFRILVLIGAVMAWISALMAYLIIEPYHKVLKKYRTSEMPAVNTGDD